jgi:hypothetical protein
MFFLCDLLNDGPHTIDNMLTSIVVKPERIHISGALCRLSGLHSGLLLSWDQTQLIV